MALQNDATITRYNDTLTASYVLTDAKGTRSTSGSQTEPVVLQRRATRLMRPWRRSRIPTGAPPRTIWPNASAWIWASSSAQRQAMIVKSSARPTVSPPIRPRGCARRWSIGPDAGLVQERAEKLLKSVVADLTDAFNVADLSEAVLLADPARLADEAAAISMMGGRRVVRVRGAGNDLADLFEEFLDDPPGDALVVVEAGDLAKGTRPAQAVRGRRQGRRHRLLCRHRAQSGRCGARRACAPKGFPSRPMRWPMRCRGWARTAA